MASLLDFGPGQKQPFSPPLLHVVNGVEQEPTLRSIIEERLGKTWGLGSGLFRYNPEGFAIGGGIEKLLQYAHAPQNVSLRDLTRGRVNNEPPRTGPRSPEELALIERNRALQANPSGTDWSRFPPNHPAMTRHQLETNPAFRAWVLRQPIKQQATYAQFLASQSRGGGPLDTLLSIWNRYIGGTTRGSPEGEEDLAPRTAQPVRMQAGGIVTKPTVALIGEAGPEAVIPLSNTQPPLASETLQPPQPETAPQWRPDQIETMQSAPEGATLRFHGTLYTKRGKQLLPQEAPSASPGLGTEIGTGLVEAGQEFASSLPGMVKTVIGTPSRLYGEVSELIRSPGTAGPQIWENAKQFAAGLVPESLKGVIRAATERDMRQLPSVRTVTRETALLGAQVFGPKLLSRGAAVTTRKALGGRSIIPGVAKGAEATLQEIAVPRARAIPAELRPLAGAEDAAYSQLDQLVQKAGNPHWSVNTVKTRARELLKEQQLLKTPLQDTGLIKDLEAFIEETKGGWDFATIKANAEKLGARLGSAPTAPVGVARLKTSERASLLQAIHEDVDRARAVRGTGGGFVTHPQPAMQEIGAQWGVARALSRRNFAATELTKMFDKSFSVKGEQITKFNPNTVLNSIDDAIKAAARGERKARLFVNAWKPGELNAVQATVRAIGKTLPQPRGLVRQAVEHGATAGIGTLIGGQTGAVIGAVTPELVAYALMTPVGRSLVRRATKLEGRIGPQTQAALVALLRAQAAAERGEQPQQ